MEVSIEKRLITTFILHMIVLSVKIKKKKTTVNE